MDMPQKYAYENHSLAMKEGKGSVSFWIHGRMKFDSLTAGRLEQVLGRLTSIETSCAYLCQRSASNPYPAQQESFEIATKFSYRNGGRIGIPRGGNKDCTMVAAAPAFPAGYAASASRVADRRMILAGYRLDLLRRLLGN